VGELGAFASENFGIDGDFVNAGQGGCNGSGVGAEELLLVDWQKTDMGRGNRDGAWSEVS